MGAHCRTLLDGSTSRPLLDGSTLPHIARWEHIAAHCSMGAHRRALLVGSTSPRIARWEHIAAHCSMGAHRRALLDGSTLPPIALLWFDGYIGSVIFKKIRLAMRSHLFKHKILAKSIGVQFFHKLIQNFFI